MTKCVQCGGGIEAGRRMCEPCFSAFDNQVKRQIRPTVTPQTAGVSASVDPNVKADVSPDDGMRRVQKISFILFLIVGGLLLLNSFLEFVAAWGIANFGMPE